MQRFPTTGVFRGFSIPFAIVMAGCSSSDTSVTPGVTPTDSGTAQDTRVSDGNSLETSATDSGTVIDATDGAVTDGPATEGGADGGTCGASPTLHVVKTGEGVYCPGVGETGFGSACAVGQVCCDTPSGSTPASSCVAGGTTCPTTTPKAGSSWACDAPVHCGAGQVCCGLGTPKLRTGCTYEEVFPAKGSTCATTCASSEYIICEAPGDCPTGKTCTPIKSGAKQIGYCK